MTATLAAHRATQHPPGTSHQAAVALLLVDAPPRLLLIRRAERHGDPWSGHVALPGGRRDPEDRDLLDTAIRETREEVGVAVQRSQCVATLDDVAPLSVALPALMVRPFVFVVDVAPLPASNPEVAFAGWVELDALSQPGVYRDGTVQVRGAARVVPGYHLPEGFLWGMTERILDPVIAEWRQLAGH